MRNELLAILLACCAWATARWARPVPGSARILRLAPATVVASALTLPAFYTIAIAVAALWGGRDAGLSGPSQPGIRGIVAGLVATAAAIVTADALTSWGPIPAAAGVYAALASVASVGGLLLRIPGAVPPARLALAEFVNLPVAILLADRLRVEDAATLTCGLGLLVGAGYLLAGAARAKAELAATHEVLASRLSELATLHAIGRDIVMTLDPGRVFSIVERECRKILDVDFFFIGVLDRDTGEIRVSFRARGDDVPHETVQPSGEGLAAWVVREKRSLRIDDVANDDLPFRPHKVDAAIRSVLAVPLIVDDRVVGVLSAQSRRPRAYDEHHLAVLATIAQQAAVAIENARHYALATIDSLTGLYLRDSFFHRLEDEYTRAKRYSAAFAILMLDLDGFKAINDQHGHAAGDRYLRGVGAAIRDRLRGADLACRYGGDEFCILLPETDLAGASAIAQRVRQAVGDLVVEVEGASLRATVSIGVASYPEHDAGDLKALLLRADQALYQAKRAGRNRVVPFAA